MAIDEENETFTFKNDLDLQIKRIRSKSFHKPWARKLPNKDADLLEYAVYNKNNFIEKKLLVEIDGGKAAVLLPISAEELSFRDDDIQFARIVNRTSSP